MALKDMKSSFGPGDSPTGIGNAARYLYKKIKELMDGTDGGPSLEKKGTPDRHEPLK